MTRGSALALFGLVAFLRFASPGAAQGVEASTIGVEVILDSFAFAESVENPFYHDGLGTYLRVEPFTLEPGTPRGDAALRDYLTGEKAYYDDEVTVLPVATVGNHVAWTAYGDDGEFTFVVRDLYVSESRGLRVTIDTDAAPEDVLALLDGVRLVDPALLERVVDGR